MKWTFLLACTLALATACEKSNTKPAEEANLKANGEVDPTNKGNIVGKWRLVEFFQDIGNGQGGWVAATDPDEITFTASGEVMVSANSPIASRGYNRYRIIDANHVELFSASNADLKEIFYYDKSSDTDLIFNPQCRENCSRKYKKVG